MRKIAVVTGIRSEYDILFSVLTGFIATKFQSANKFNDGNSSASAETELASIRDLLESQAQSLHNLEIQISQLQAQLNRIDRS